MTNAQEDSSIKTPTPNMFSSSFGLVISITRIDVMAMMFNQ
jgi:hypothetical protein